jgi:hypothetical protein
VALGIRYVFLRAALSLDFSASSFICSFFPCRRFSLLLRLVKTWSLDRTHALRIYGPLSLSYYGAFWPGQRRSLIILLAKQDHCHHRTYPELGWLHCGNLARDERIGEQSNSRNHLAESCCSALELKFTPSLCLAGKDLAHQFLHSPTQHGPCAGSTGSVASTTRKLGRVPSNGKRFVD